MQIIVRLHSGDNYRDTMDLYRLLCLLKAEIYEICKDFGNYIYDAESGEAINCDIQSEHLSISVNAVMELLHRDAKLMIIDPKKKSASFIDRFFPTVYFFISKGYRPLTPRLVIDYFDSLIRQGNEELLDNLYRAQAN